MNEKKFDELNLGDSCEKEITITDEMVEKFIGLSGDVNPIHVDPAHAREHGFSGRVVHGALASSIVSGMLGLQLPGKWGLLIKMDLNFKNPIYINDTLLYSLKITSKNFGNMVSLQLTVKNLTRKGEVSISGEIISRLLK